MTDETVPAAAGPAGRRRSTWAPILLRIGLLIALLGLLAGGAWLLGPWSPDRLRGLLAPAGPLAPAVFVGLFVVLNSAGVPGPLLGAAGGLALGLVPGALATLAGMTVAACVQFLLARRLTGPAMAAVRFSGADRLQQALQRRGWLAVVALRLVPGPFVALNLAAGLTPLRLRWMAVGTLIGGVPKALGWDALGLGASHLAVSPLVVAAVIVASVALTVVWLRWGRPWSAQAHAQPAASVADPFPEAQSRDR
jgi:uncharacterized membrane protein YdjX (TVP38/TMEM64 family)